MKLKEEVEELLNRIEKMTEKTYDDLKSELTKTSNIDERIKLFRTTRECLKTRWRILKRMITEVDILVLVETKKILLADYEDLKGKLKMDERNTKEDEIKLKLFSLFTDVSNDIRIIKNSKPL